MALLYEAYQEKRIGSRALNQHRFHTTMLRLSYALERRVYQWADIPYASEFVAEFARPGGISNAFMNLSNFSNESETWMANYHSIDTFIAAIRQLPVNFFAAEIDLLSPDIICGMNLGGWMACLETFESSKMYGERGDVCFQTLRTPSGRTYPYLDCWHFSAPGKSAETDIFNPVIASLKDNGIID